MEREIIDSQPARTAIDIVVEGAIDQMHVEAIIGQLWKMEAGEVERLKEAQSIEGDITYLARYLWQEYQKRHK